MNETIYQGETLEDALEQAAVGLGVQAEELAYEITEEKKGGFWGVDESYVRLRAWTRPEEETLFDEEGAAAPEEDDAAVPDEHDASEPDEPRAAKPSTVATEPATPEPNSSAPAASGPGGFWEEADPATVPEEDKTPTPPLETEDDAEIAVDVKEPAPTEDATAPAVPPVSGEPTADEAATDSAGQDAAVVEEKEQTKEAGDASTDIETLVHKVLGGMDFDCTVDVRAEAEVYMVMIGGPDKELLLEGNGRALSALELILNHAFRHRLTERRKIRVDAGDFRSRQEDELRDLAYQVAHSAKETERTQETQPLNPYERRLVHLALAEDSGITTRSRGSGFLKNVQVIPRRSGRGNR